MMGEWGKLTLQMRMQVFASIWKWMHIQVLGTQRTKLILQLFFNLTSGTQLCGMSISMMPEAIRLATPFHASTCQAHPHRSQHNSQTIRKVDRLQLDPRRTCSRIPRNLLLKMTIALSGRRKLTASLGPTRVQSRKYSKKVELQKAIVFHVVIGW